MVYAIAHIMPTSKTGAISVFANTLIFQRDCVRGLVRGAILGVGLGIGKYLKASHGFSSRLMAY